MLIVALFPLQVTDRAQTATRLPSPGRGRIKTEALAGALAQLAEQIIEVEARPETPLELPGLVLRLADITTLDIH